MNTLYKYYSSSFDIISYLSSPTIRISQIPTLNDPFEGLLTSELIDKFYHKYKEHYSSDPDHNLASRRELKIYLMRYIRSFGIVSLSETQRNLLMWAHYSSEHKGVCIGYNTALLDNINSQTPVESEDRIIFRKVNYDSILFDNEHLEAMDDLDLTDNNYFEWIAERILTTKSNDWSYEKEHRFITHISRGDKIIIPRKQADLSNTMSLNIKLAVEIGTHLAEYENNRTIITSITNQMERSKIIDNDNQILEKQISHLKDVLFLTTIKKQDIKSIYIGARYDFNKKDELFKTLESDKELQHINVYDYSLSHNRYELTANKVEFT